MSRWERAKRAFFGPPKEERGASLNEYIQWIQQAWPGGLNGLETLGSKQEEIAPTFEGFAERIYRANPIVFGCMQARSSLFCEARFKYRKDVEGRPGELFATKSLRPLEEPWPEAATSDLLRRMLNDVDLAGNFFGVKREGGIERLRPDWVTIILRGRGYGYPGATPFGYVYTVGGKGGEESFAFDADQVAHWAPIPDPIFAWRGMSWLQPIIKDVVGDLQGTQHKVDYLEGGATPNAVIQAGDKLAADKFIRFKEIFKEERAKNPYETLFLGGGADYKVIGNDMTKVDWKAIQSLGENRICVAARVPSVIAGVSEGLEASNYGDMRPAKKLFAEGTMVPLWKGACEALAPLITVPRGAELTFDSEDIPYLGEEIKDVAETQRMQGEAANKFFIAGYTPESIVEYLAANDITRLEHTGLPSVQTQPDGSTESSPEMPMEGNGKGNPDAVPAPSEGEQ